MAGTSEIARMRSDYADAWAGARSLEMDVAYSAIRPVILALHSQIILRRDAPLRVVRIFIPLAVPHPCAAGVEGDNICVIKVPGARQGDDEPSHRSPELIDAPQA